MVAGRALRDTVQMREAVAISPRFASLHDQHPSRAICDQTFSRPLRSADRAGRGRRSAWSAPRSAKLTASSAGRRSATAVGVEAGNLRMASIEEHHAILLAPHTQQGEIGKRTPSSDHTSCGRWLCCPQAGGEQASRPPRRCPVRRAAPVHFSSPWDIPRTGGIVYRARRRRRWAAVVYAAAAARYSSSSGKACLAHGPGRVYRQVVVPVRQLAARRG
jgi:hypothetical protein